MQERAQLAALVRHAGADDERQLGLDASGSQIQPIILGADSRAMALAAALQARGYDIRAIRPPTVPEGTARLRIALTLHADAAIWTRCSRTWPPKWRRHESRPMRFVVTGTDTGIGKTVFAAALTGALGGIYWKPVQAGLDGETDSETVARLAGVEVAAGSLSLQAGGLAAPGGGGRRHHASIRPDWCCRTPMAPLVVEGAGGLMVPLTERHALSSMSSPAGACR